MKELISFYDNFIIYHPNYFFSSFFFFVTFLLIFFVATISQFTLKNSTQNKIRKIKINYASIKTIFLNAPIAVGFVISNKINKLTVLHISKIKNLALFYIKKINKLAVYFELRAEKEIKKIAKAILIDE